MFVLDVRGVSEPVQRLRDGLFKAQRFAETLIAFVAFILKAGDPGAAGCGAPESEVSTTGEFVPVWFTGGVSFLRAVGVSILWAIVRTFSRTDLVRTYVEKQL
jgi:hypothetical protein